MRPQIKTLANSVAFAASIALLLADTATGQVGRPSAGPSLRPATGTAPVTVSGGSVVKGDSISIPGVKPEVRREHSLRPPVDIDPDAPIQPRTPFPKWGAAGIGSIEAQLGERARLTDRIFVKFRDDLKVRSTLGPGTTLEQETAGGGATLGPDPLDELDEARALLASLGGTVEQAIKIPLPRLKAIEERATLLSRREQPDLGGLMLVSVGKARVREAAEAFNGLDCVEFASVEMRPKVAQCQPLDQSLQKGAASVGANVTGCTQTTDANGNPLVCQPAPIIANPTIDAETQPFLRTGFGFVNCNRPSFWAGYIPFNTILGASCAAAPPLYAADLTTIPFWDCTPACNSPVLCANTTNPLWTQGGNPACQYGCADSPCATVVATYQPACSDSTQLQGWDATCATIAALVCPTYAGSATPYNGIVGGSGTVATGAIAIDQVTADCYQTNPPVAGPPVQDFDVNTNLAYDPCFAARGPASYAFTTPTSVGVIAYTDIGDGSGVRPWGFTYAAAKNTMPVYGYLQFTAPGTPFAATCTGIPTAGGAPLAVGGTVRSSNTFDATLAGFAVRDPVFKGGPELFSHPCSNADPLPGCNITPCCVAVCIQDPGCCDTEWDSGCVDLTNRAPALNLCNVATLGMASTASSQTPAFAAVPNAAGTRASNLQLHTTRLPCVASTGEYIQICPTPTTAGTVSLQAVTTQGGLNSTLGFINSQYGGGGLDLEGMENFAQQLTSAEGGGISREVAKGQGVTVGVIDYSAYLNHEDLVGQVTIEAGQTVFLQPGGDIDPDHGTAVLGVIVAAENSIGVTGVAPRAAAIFYPAATSTQFGRMATAIVSAGEDLDVGDVLCIPLELGEGGGAPVCSDPAYNTLLGVSASLGITNVCAAGNGGFATLAPASGVNNAVLVSSVWPGAQTPTPVSGTKTAGPPASNTLVNPGTIAPGNQYCRYKSSNYSTTVGLGAGVDVSGWGTAICTLGRGTLWTGANNNGNPLETNKLRTYQQFFGETSGASAMIAGLVCRIQAVSSAALGSAVSGERIRQVLADQLYVNGTIVIGSNGAPVPIGSSNPQCNLAPGVALPGTTSTNFWVVALGDLIAPPNNSATNRVGGFPRAVDCLQQVVFTQFFPQGTPFDVTVINGLRLQSSVFDLAALDGSFYRVSAVRRGRGSTGTGYGRPLVYAASGLVTDLQLRGRLTVQSANDLFWLGVAGYGRATNTGSVSGTGAMLAIMYAYDTRYQRWRYFGHNFVTGANPIPGSPNVSGAASNLGYQPSDFVVNEGGTNVVYVRVVTFSASIPGPYQAWWDQLSITTSPLINP